jgi:hypothetical protein
MLELYAMKVARTVLRGCFVVILNGASTDPKIAWGLFNKSEKLQGKLYFLLPSGMPYSYSKGNLNKAVNLQPSVTQWCIFNTKVTKVQRLIGEYH